MRDSLTVENILPVGSQILIEVIHESPQTAGGIFRPHYEKFLRNEGIVRRIPDGEQVLHPGDRVIIPRYEGMREVDLSGEVDSKHFVLIDREEIIGVIDETS